jgi:hypothetical protein
MAYRLTRDRRLPTQRPAQLADDLRGSVQMHPLADQRRPPAVGARRPHPFEDPHAPPQEVALQLLRDDRLSPPERSQRPPAARWMRWWLRHPTLFAVEPNPPPLVCDFAKRRR